MTMFEECLQALQGNYTVLSARETTQLYEGLNEFFPFTLYGRIDWEKVEKKKAISLEEAKKIKDDEVLVIWDNADVPAIKSTFSQVLHVIDDVTAVGFDTWIFFPRTLQVIEFYGNDINAGIGTNIYDKLRECYEQFKVLNLNEKDFSGEFGEVVSDIINVGNVILEIASRLLENASTSEKDLDLVEKKYMTKTAWNIKNGKVMPLFKEPFVLNYAQKLEELKELCRCAILYKKVIDIANQPH